MSQEENQAEKPVAASGAKALLEEITQVLSESAPEVRARLKSLRVERVINDRVNLLDKAFAKVQDARNELKKIKPDIKQRDKEGNLVETWSNEAWEKKQKAVEALAKLEKATDTAFEGKGFDELAKLV